MLQRNATLFWHAVACLRWVLRRNWGDSSHLSLVSRKRGWLMKCNASMETDDQTTIAVANRGSMTLLRANQLKAESSHSRTAAWMVASIWTGYSTGCARYGRSSPDTSQLPVESISRPCREPQVHLRKEYKCSPARVRLFSMSKSSDRRRQVLAFIQARVEADGRPPTLDEIAIACGFASRSAAQKHVRALEDSGDLQVSRGQSRGARPKKSKPTPPGAQQLFEISPRDVADLSDTDLRGLFTRQ
jgi:hypothetical protein